MKKLIPFLTVLIIITIIIILFLSFAKKEYMITVHEGNFKQLPIAIKPGLQDPECKMTLADKKYACEVVAKDGKTWFFDDVGCMVNWLEDKSFKQSAILWINDIDTNKWINARNAWYSQIENTPMGYGFGAHEKQSDEFINFEQMSLKMLRGENLTNPHIRKKLLGK